LPSRFLENEEAPMATRPTYVRGIAFVILAAVVVLSSAWLAVLRSDPLAWLSTVIIAIGLTVGGLIGWRRGIQSARERAWTTEFSFGSEVVKMRAREAAQALVIEERRAELLGARYPQTVSAGAK
jgi:hypothetical protein